MSGELFNILTTWNESHCKRHTIATSTVWRHGGGCRRGTFQRHRLWRCGSCSSPSKTKYFEHVQSQRSSSRRWELRDAILQNPDKCVAYQPTEERVITMVEAKLSVRSPDVHVSQHVRRARRGGTSGARKRRRALLQMRRTQAYRSKIWIARAAEGRKEEEDSRATAKGKGEGQVDWNGFCSFWCERCHAQGTDGASSEMKEEEENEQVLRPWRTRMASTRAPARSTGSTSRRWIRRRRKSGRRSTDDAHV